MKKILFTLLVTVLMTLPLQAQNTPTVKKVYDETIDPIEQIDHALAQAKAEGKFVIAQVGGNWCPWCLRFAAFMEADSAISEILLKRLGNCGRFGYPVMVVLDPDGHVLHIQDSAYLEQDKSYSHDKVMSFFKHWTPAAVRGE